MKGFIYRVSITLKDFGERVKSPAIIRWGLAIRELALRVRP